MKKKLFELFLTFAKIGLFTFGGGYAMLALIEDECVEKKGWLTSDQMATITALAEATPGPIATNCATYTGYLQAGVVGASVATVGMVIPSFVIIFLISLFFDRFLEIAIIANAFKGIKIAVGVLIVNAAANMIKKMSKNTLSVWIMLVSYAVMWIVNVFAIRFSTIYILLITGMINLVICSIQQVIAKRGEVE